MTTFDVDLALEQFNKRVAANPESKQINNSSLHAGAPMIYYCRFCGCHTETLPECHVSRPKTCCDPCKVLNDHGLIATGGRVLKDPPVKTNRFEHKEPL
jgi:hypothetical protein